MQQWTLQGRSEQTALERQDLPCLYLTHQELEDVHEKYSFLSWGLPAKGRRPELDILCAQPKSTVEVDFVVELETILRFLTLVNTNVLEQLCILLEVPATPLSLTVTLTVSAVDDMSITVTAVVTHISS